MVNRNRIETLDDNGVSLENWRQEDKKSEKLKGRGVMKGIKWQE